MAFILNKYKIWCENTQGKVLKELLDNKDNLEYIESIFSSNLKFGTAGLRAKMSAGTNRLNIYTIAHASKALATYISQKSDNKKVVIGYDARHNSYEFSQKAAEILSQNGIEVYLINSLCATPMLSYATKKLGCFMGIMITASHNPPEYNGYKVYDQNGSAICVKTAEDIMSIMNQTDMFSFENTGEIREIIVIYDDIGYTDEVIRQSINKNVFNGSNYKICYTPLSGVGGKFMIDIFKKLGFDSFNIVPEQEKPDGDFTNCRYPNPEHLPSFDCGIKLMKKIDANLLIASDPDADRIGVCVKKDDEIYYFSGNQIAMLLLDYILTYKKGINDGDIVFSTVVSTKMVDEIAKEYNLSSIKVLPGFKYIGEQLVNLKDKGQLSKYLFSFEESLGYHIGGYTFDKDGICAGMLVCEMAILYNTQNIDLVDKYNELCIKYGYFEEKVVNFSFDTLDGAEKMNLFMQKLRETDEFLIEGHKKLERRDYLENQNSNILEYIFDGKLSILIRPSGTEPKIKAYINVCENTREEACKKVIEVEQQIQKNFLL